MVSAIKYTEDQDLEGMKFGNNCVNYILPIVLARDFHTFHIKYHKYPAEFEGITNI
jgi:hypothetical protein